MLQVLPEYLFGQRLIPELPSIPITRCLCCILRERAGSKAETA